MMLFKEIIARKRDRHQLSGGEIDQFVIGLANNSLPAEQVSALAMAVFLNGMDFEETAALTRAMAGSGVELAWNDLPGPAVDKHSTGGVGDKVSFLLAPIVAACGGYVPMISGRGLGHTGGTLDKIDAIPGYQSQPDLETFRKVVKAAGCAIIGQTADVAPADRRFYAIRDVTGTVESIPLITASILSKKIAAGNQALVMDVKVGSGAFMRNLDQARALADSIIGTAQPAGLPTTALITDMDQVLGDTAGNAVEIAESVAFLTGQRREPRLDAVALGLAAEMLVITGLEPDLDMARMKADEAIESGRAAEHFAHMVRALGGPADFLEKADLYLPQTRFSAPVFPAQSGYVGSVDGRTIGNAIIELGGGRRQISDTVNPAPGFTHIRPIGCSVGPDRPLAIAHADSPDALDKAVAAYGAAIGIVETPPGQRPVILERRAGA